MTDSVSGAPESPLPEPPSELHLREGAVQQEEERARRLARRYRLEYVDMGQFYVDQAMFRSIPGRPDAALRIRTVSA